MENNILKEYYNKANMFYKNGDYENAIEYFTKIIELMPNSPKIYYNRGLTFCQIAINNLSDAQMQRDIHLKTQNELKENYLPRNPTADYESTSTNKEISEKQSKYEDVIKYNLDNSEYQDNKINNKHTKNIKNPDKYIQCQEAYKKAIEDFINAIRIDQTFAEAYYNLASVYLNIGQYELAIENYNYVIAIKPFYLDAYNNLGFSYYNLKEYDKAIENYCKVIELDPINAVAYNNRANAYDDKGEYNKAIEDYTKALSIENKNGEFFYNRAILFYKNKNYSEAAKDFENALEQNKNDTDAYLYLGFSYFELKEYDKSFSIFQMLLHTHERYIAYLYIAKIYNAKKEYDKAIDIYTILIEQSENKEAELFYERGLTYLNKTEYINALNDFDKAVTINKNFDLAYYQRDITLKKINENK